MQELLAKPIDSLTDEELSSVCIDLNVDYRRGTTIISDDGFELYMNALKVRIPDHDLITKPQPTDTDEDTSKGRIKHLSAMLSTDKAYELEEVESFISRCEKKAIEIGLNTADIRFRVLPKLDGIAGELVVAKQQLSTRGDGMYGHEMSHLLRDGLVIVGNGSKDGVGEVVVLTDYYNKFLAEEFEHPRSMVGGMTKSDNYNEFAQQALKDGAIHLVLFRDLPVVVATAQELVANLADLEQKMIDETPYLLDGTIIEVENEDLKAAMGSNSSEHRWQIAKKVAGETAVTKVINEIWQVGRTGRITPVFEFEATQLSGATLTKFSGKHARYVQVHKLGLNAEVRIIRSGEVIPNHLKTEVGVEPNTPTHCPCCSEPVVWKKSPQTDVDTFIYCENIACPAQYERAIMHHFKTIGVDLFGKVSVRKLVDADYTCIEQIYLMNEEAFMAAGFGAGQAKNFVEEINRGIREPLQDKFLLASLGISKLGRGTSEKLLAIHRINTLEGLDPEQLRNIAGFGDKTSVSIPKALTEKAQTLNFLLGRGFNLNHTQDILSKAPTGGSLEGIHIVFTGSMSGSRDDMKADAKSKNANVQGSVNGKTNILCCGEKVGQKKLDAAKAKGVEIITEAEYWERYAA